MKGIIVIFILFISKLVFAGEGHFIHGDERSAYWSQYSNNEKANIERLIKILKNSKTGQRLLSSAREKANKSGKQLIDIFMVGNGSLTDTTLIRRFSASDPSQVEYESKSKIYLNKELSLQNIILDMSHELTHYIYRVPFNPYTKNFSLKDFIASTVEGRGGEVEAFMIECRVMRELFPKVFAKNYNCQKIIDDAGRISKQRTIRHFYRVGNHYNYLWKKLGRSGISSNDFPNISDSEASFISSAYGLPYPVAAYEEYRTVLSKACENDKKRLHYFKRRQQRSPASMMALTHYQEFLQDYSTRCHAL